MKCFNSEKKIGQFNAKAQRRRGAESFFIYCPKILWKPQNTLELLEIFLFLRSFNAAFISAIKKINFVLSTPLRLCAFALKYPFFTSTLKFPTLALLLCSITSCQRAGLDVQNQYISYRDLASYRVGTPDWRKECPDFGQRILISWNIRQCCCPGELTLRLYLQFGNFEDTIIEKKCCSRGNYTYELINQEYTAKRGIASYKVEICCDGQPIKTLNHLLWVEKINLNSSTSNSEPTLSEPLLLPVEPSAPIVHPLLEQ